MNVKNKIVALAMSFIICFGTVSTSFCNDKEYINIENKERSALATLGGYVITKETFNIIVGVASACGVALLTDNDAFDFVQNTINAYVRKYEKVDSGDFTTKKAIENFENEIKNGSSKDPKDPTKLIVNSSLVGLFVSLFDSIKADEESVNVVGSVVPIEPKYYELYKDLEVDVPVYVHLIDGDRVSFRLKDNGWTEFLFDTDKALGYVGSSNNTPQRVLSYVKCGKTSWCATTRCKNFNQPNYYHLGHKSLTHTNYNVFKYKNDTTYYIDYYIPTTKFMGSYVPINKDTTVENKYVPTSTNPNVSVDGVLDVPSGSAPGGSDIDFEMPPVPGFDDEGIDLSFLTDLFEHLKGKFPFSIPFDLYNLIDVLRTEPIPPKFDFEFLDNEICLDLTQFEIWANIVRSFSVFSWVFVLFTFTKKLGG